MKLITDTAHAHTLFYQLTPHDGDDFKHSFAEVYVTFNTMLKLALVFMVISCVLMAEARRLPRLRLQETERYQRQFLKVGLLIEGD